MKFHLPPSLLVLLLTTQIVAAEFYHVGDTHLEFNREKGSFQLTIPGAPSAFTCDRFWDLRFFDRAAREANTRPAEVFQIGCNSGYVQSKAILSPKGAHLQNVNFNQQTGVFTADYLHPDAAVELQISLSPNGADIQLTVTNHSMNPISSIYPVPKLEFRLEDRNMILPHEAFNGVETSGCRDCYYWTSSHPWNGILLPARNGSVFAVDVIPDSARRFDPVESHINGDRQTGRTIQFTAESVCWLKEGESRRSPIIRLRDYPSLRNWADHYARSFFPDGMKTLEQKYSPDLWERLRHASWAAGEGKIAELLPVVTATPGRILLQNGNYMHPLQGGKEKVQLDSFPNYFPVNPYFGTDAQYEQLIHKVADNGGIYVPRTSFFYWVKGSDFDNTHDLKKHAIVRVDGTAHTAQWGRMPGYIVSPSDSTVAAEMKRTSDQFKSLGATGYFTNVICAINAFSIRYDFHPNAPAPDLLYAQIDHLFQDHGEGRPLFSEGGSNFLLIPHQAGICNAMGENRDDPAAIRLAGKWLIAPRLSWAPVLMLSHEYISNLPHNLSSKDATTTILRLTHSLLNGFILKIGLAPKQQLTRSNLLWIRACAILSQEVTSRLIGRRLLSYEEKGDIVTADYSGSIVAANFSNDGIPWKAGINRGVIAPDGFGFQNDADGVTAGYFSELNGVKYPVPLLLLAVKQAGNVRLFAPLETKPVKVVWNGATVEIPAYIPRLERTVRGVTLAADGKCIADPDGTGFSPAETGTGFDAPPPPPRAGNIPLLIDWDHSKPLPPELKLTAPAAVTPEGIRLTGKNGIVIFQAPSPFKRRIHAELVFRYDRMPGFPDRLGNASLISPLLPPDAYYWLNRTVELGYNLYNEKFLGQFQAAAGGSAFGTGISGISIIPGKFYHVCLILDGEKLTLTVNGKTVEKNVSGIMRETLTGWQFGGTFDYMTISLIRFGGE